MKEIVEKLKAMGLKHLPDVSRFMTHQDKKLGKKLSKEELYELALSFAKKMEEAPKITDFINYDMKGSPVIGNKPIFHDWRIDTEASSKTKKVAFIMINGVMTKITFHGKEGVIIQNRNHISDHVKYKDLATFFDYKLKFA